MSFKEFDMTEYFNVLEAFKTEHQDKVIKMYGSIDKYNTRIEKMKACEAKLAKMAIKQYGSIKKYAEAVKKNLNNSLAITNGEQIDEFKKDCLYDKHPKLKELYKKLTADLSKDPSSTEIRQIVSQIIHETQKQHDILKVEVGENYWSYMAEQYLSEPPLIKANDKEYGNGASKFIGESLRFYVKNQNSTG